MTATYLSATHPAEARVSTVLQHLPSSLFFDPTKSEQAIEHTAMHYNTILQNFVQLQFNYVHILLFNFCDIII